jgi:hypothetical protein
MLFYSSYIRWGEKPLQVGVSFKILDRSFESFINHQLHTHSLFYFYICTLFYYFIMISFPPRLQQGTPDGQSQPVHSRPVSPLPSPSITLHDQSSSASSSTYFLNASHDSTTNLPRYPRPAFLRGSSTTSLTSEIDDFEGSTACPTPNPESVLGDTPYKINLGAVSKSVWSSKTHFDPDTYTIETLNKHDDADLLKPWKRKLYRLSPLFTFFTVAAYFLYYGYRIHCTINAQRAYHKTYIMAWVFIAAEGCVACKSLVFLISSHFRA